MDKYTLQCWARRFNLRYGQKDLPAFIFLTDKKRVPDIENTIQQLPGKSLIIVRDYEIPNRADYVKKIVALSRCYGHKVLIANDEALAIRYRADGVHFPEWNYRKALRSKRKHPQWLVSTSIHSLKGLLRLGENTIDFALLSPAFPTLSHPEKQMLGAVRFSTINKKALQPIYPLGGINQGTILQLKRVNIPGIAAITALSVTH